MFESRDQPLISRRRFAKRFAIAVAMALAIDSAAVAFGAIGYHSLEGMDWLKASVNASMVITGNGLVSRLHTTGGMIFSIFDAIIGVLAFVLVSGLLLGPVFHRVLHAFHIPPEE